VKRRKGRRNLANFENLPVSTHVYKLSEAERACPCCGLTRKEIGADESWQVEYLPGHFERIHHVRKNYACTSCETNGENPSIQAAPKPETAIDKGLAGPGLLAYIVTSKYSDYLPLYRLEDIFARQCFEISRATQSVWCGDVADFVVPLYQLMADRVRASHVVATDDTIMPMQSKDKTANARMWVYVGDGAQPYNVFDFTMDRGRDGPKRFLKDYGQVLLWLCWLQRCCGRHSDHARWMHMKERSSMRRSPLPRSPARRSSGCVLSMLSSGRVRMPPSQIA
jgi:transposase